MPPHFTPFKVVFPPPLKNSKKIKPQKGPLILLLQSVKFLGFEARDPLLKTNKIEPQKWPLILLLISVKIFMV